MFYTQEESAVLGGFLSSYLNRDSASDHVRDAFARFQVGLERGCLQKSELQWAEQMLLALGLIPVPVLEAASAEVGSSVNSVMITRNAETSLVLNFFNELPPCKIAQEKADRGFPVCFVI